VASLTLEIFFKLIFHLLTLLVSSRSGIGD
jgi:hypothetical protein